MSNYFDFKTAKRYYHVLVFKFDVKYSLKAFWKDCRIDSKGSLQNLYEDSDIVIEKQSLVTPTQYYFGESDYSQNADFLPPYVYDLFAVYIKDHDVVIFGFPFKNLAKDTVRSLIEDKRYKTKGSFLKPSISKILKETGSEHFGNDFLECSFNGLAMVITGDKNITSINLGGDNPLESTLYRKNFKKMIEENISTPEHGSVRCELSGTEHGSLPNTRSTIHLDNFGNFKMYFHASGRNVFTLPYFILILRKLKCLVPTITNPLNAIEDESL